MPCLAVPCFPTLSHAFHYFPEKKKFLNRIYTFCFSLQNSSEKLIILRRTDGSPGSRMWGYGLDRAGSGYGQVAGACEYGNELSGSVKCREFLD